LILGAAGGQHRRARRRGRGAGDAAAAAGAAAGARAAADALSLQLRIAEQYVEAFGQIAKEGNTVLIPANAADAGGMIASALSIFKVDLHNDPCCDFLK